MPIFLSVGGCKKKKILFLSTTDKKHGAHKTTVFHTPGFKAQSVSKIVVGSNWVICWMHIMVVFFFNSALTEPVLSMHVLISILTLMVKTKKAKNGRKGGKAYGRMRRGGCA